MRSMLVDLVLIVFGIFILTTSSFAQAPDTVWSHTYKTNSAALSLYEMPDGGFVLGGYATPDGDSYRDMYIVRTDSEGDTLWTKFIGQAGRYETANCLYPTADGGFILTGNRGQDAPYTSYSDIYLVKTDRDGEFEWGSMLGASDESETGIATVPTLDGGYLAMGDFWNSSTVYDILLYKTDSIGNMAWPYQFTWADADYPTSIGITSDFGFAVTGYTQSFDAEYDYDMFILRLNQAGSEMWSRAYGSSHPYDESANYICNTSDGGFLMCGYRRDVSWPKDIYVVKTDSSGDVEWTSQLGGTYHDEARCCIETVDGGYAVSAGWYMEGNWKVGLIKYNAVGDTMWTAFWGDSTNSHTPYGLVQTADNGYAVGGLMSGGTNAAFLVKFAGEPGVDPYNFWGNALDVPVGDTYTSSDTITVSIDGSTRSIIGVKVMIDTLDHPAVDELAVTIEHDGTEVSLVAEGDASGANFTGTVLADAAMTILSRGVAPYTGLFRPSGHLKAFDGMNPNGDWILYVSDSTSGNDGVLKAWGITLLTDITLDAEDQDDEGLLPEFNLSQCYPNPFNPATTIDYSLPRRSKATIEVFNILGKKITTLVDEVKPAGEYRVTWDGKSSGGEPVSTGIYFYRFKAGERVETKKMMLLK